MTPDNAFKFLSQYFEPADLRKMKMGVNCCLRLKVPYKQVPKEINRVFEDYMVRLIKKDAVQD
jgi:hypothetical protein